MAAPPTPIATATPHSRLPALLQRPQARRSMYPRRSATVHARTPKHDGPRTNAEARRCLYERLSRRSSYQRRSTMVHVGAPAGAKAAHPPRRRQSPPQRPIRACRRSYRGRERDGPCTNAEARRCMYERLSRRSSYQRRSTMVHVGAPAGAKAAHPPHRRQLPPQRPIRACRGAPTGAASATVHVPTPKRDGACTNA